MIKVSSTLPVVGAVVISGVGPVPAADVADRVGRRRVLLLGFAVFGGGSLLVLLADSAGAVIGLGDDLAS